MLEEHTIKHIPIVENKEILGMLSSSGLLKV
jgi:signal-transduction protein with cAMP-binding, CBS, and nucleotidyltransferase domain